METEYLYRYQPFIRRDGEENIGIFTKKEIFIASPTSFNDPFDCQAFLTHEGCSEEDLLKFFAFRYKNVHENEDEETVLNAARERLEEFKRDEMSNGTSRLRESLKDHKDRFIRDIRGDQSRPGIGIISLSEVKDDILMWGHYADSHKGYCLELNKNNLEKWVNSISGNLKKVNYSNKYPNLKDYLDHTIMGPGASLDDLFLLRKSSHWEYEKEWRIIVNIEWWKEFPQIRRIPENILNGVIFGCEMKEEQISTIKRHLDVWEEKPNFYKAQKSENIYALDILPI